MTTYIPSYLRALSQIRTGTHSGVDQKTDDVEAVSCPNIEALEFEQQETVNLWVNKQAYHGKQVVTSDRQTRVDKTVDHPERHWWIIAHGLLENTDPPLRDHADIFDFLIALNLSTEDPVFFSQNPGQVTGGAYSYNRGALDYRDDLSPGNIATALLGLNEIPDKIKITGDVISVYEDVREYRSKQIETDAEMDLRVALHMYDDALSSDIWTAMTNLYFVCENLLSSGRRGDKDQRIADSTILSVDDAEAWREMVNRIKHPDKGEKIEGLLNQDDLEVPTLRRMRTATNTVLKESMNETTT
ncbi:hypothetical protein [Haloarchaeobius amylolyticus]|uniref:hypothetical protein n=1 Tax=Haloarchaeobius amylolyticus TaxID=1198296 RepID=UPI00226D82D1|nr:hypothetical protein [Haloarchaeobius amylolyticus]